MARPPMASTTVDDASATSLKTQTSPSRARAATGRIVGRGGTRRKTDNNLMAAARCPPVVTDQCYIVGAAAFAALFFFLLEDFFLPLAVRIPSLLASFPRSR